MIALEQMRRVLHPLAVRVRSLLGRGLIQTVDDTKGIQEVQVGLLSGETRARVPRLQDYGITSNPPVGSEAAIGFRGGLREAGMVLRAEHRGSRPTGLEPGEVAVYSDEGDRLHFKRGRKAELTDLNELLIRSKVVRIEGDLYVTGEVGDRVDTGGDRMSQMRGVFDRHRHLENGQGNFTDLPTPEMGEGEPGNVGAQFILDGGTFDQPQGASILDAGVFS